ncbi:MAG: RNA 2',3'-cyclic phosphodiesterase [Pyrinomonadaceae bacterium]
MADGTSSWRVFYALELPAEVREKVAAHIARLRGAIPAVRASWERAEKLHLTVKFFGDVERARVEEQLAPAAARAAQNFLPFNLVVEGAGAFPPHGLPKVLWLGIADASGALSHLQSALESECAKASFPRERRVFHPHITIARLRTPAGAKELAAIHAQMGFEAIALTVSEIVLMRSELTPNGSRYTIISRHELSKS